MVTAFGQPLQQADRRRRFSAARWPGHKDAAAIWMDADRLAVLISEQDIVARQRRLELAQVVRDKLLDKFDHTGAVIRIRNLEDRLRARHRGPIEADGADLPVGIVGAIDHELIVIGSRVGPVQFHGES